VSDRAKELLARWRADLDSWAIPPEIIGRAAQTPWGPEREVFIRRARVRTAAPGGASYRRAAEALPSEGSGGLLDIGAGAGAASLPLLEKVASLVAVDADAPLLAELVRQAGTAATRVRTVIGRWPDVAAGVEPADVVVCHHVLYNVPDLAPFVAALTAHARRRVVIEITAAHPLARLNPLWERFHGLVRPTRPTWSDAAETIRSLGNAVQVEREQLPADPPGGTWDELVAATARRLCLGPERAFDVAAALEAEGTRQADPATWTPQIRSAVTLWWDVPPPPAARD